MSLWKLLKKMGFKKQRWLEVRRMPVGLERSDTKWRSGFIDRVLPV